MSLKEMKIFEKYETHGAVDKNEKKVSKKC